MHIRGMTMSVHYRRMVMHMRVFPGKTILMLMCMMFIFMAVLMVMCYWLMNMFDGDAGLLQRSKFPTA